MRSRTSLTGAAQDFPRLLLAVMRMYRPTSSAGRVVVSPSNSAPHFFVPGIWYGCQPGIGSSGEPVGVLGEPVGVLGLSRGGRPNRAREGVAGQAGVEVFEIAGVLCRIGLGARFSEESQLDQALVASTAFGG